MQLSANLPIDSNQVTDFGITIPVKGEQFVSVKLEITLVDPEVYRLPVVCDIKNIVIAISL